MKGEASMRGHLAADGAEQAGSQSYVPPNEKDDKALGAAFNLLRGVTVNAKRRLRNGRWRTEPDAVVARVGSPGVDLRSISATSMWVWSSRQACHVSSRQE